MHNEGSEVVDLYLRRIDFARDGYAQLIHSSSNLGSSSTAASTAASAGKRYRKPSDGWHIVTLAEHYGMPADEQVADTEWIEEAAKRGWPILMKDKRIRHRQVEIDAVIAHAARCFVITRGDLPSGEMVDRFMANKVAIHEAVARPGPYIFSVQIGRLQRLYPP